MDDLIPLDKIRDMLADRRLYVVAEAAGLSYPTVKNVADGGDNVTISTWRKLSEYFGGNSGAGRA